MTDFTGPPHHACLILRCALRIVYQVFPIIDAMLKVAREDYVPGSGPSRGPPYLGGNNIQLGRWTCVLEPRTLAKSGRASGIGGRTWCSISGCGTAILCGDRAYGPKLMVAVEADEQMAKRSAGNADQRRHPTTYVHTGALCRRVHKQHGTL